MYLEICSSDTSMLIITSIKIIPPLFQKTGINLATQFLSTKFPGRGMTKYVHSVSLSHNNGQEQNSGMVIIWFSKLVLIFDILLFCFKILLSFKPQHVMDSEHLRFLSYWQFFANILKPFFCLFCHFVFKNVLFYRPLWMANLVI